MKQPKLINNMIKNLIKIFIFTSLVTGVWTQAFELSEKVLQAEQAVYKVTASLGYGIVGYGTGFFIAPDLFVTNFHVINEIKNLDDISLDHRDRPSIGIRKIIAVSLFADIAIFQTKEKSPVYLPEGKLNSLDENLVIVGHVKGENTAHYIKSANKSSVWEDIVYSTPTDFSSDSRGLSGSPLMNLDGEFVGIVFTSDDNFKSSIISQYVSQLLEGRIGTLCQSIECIDQETQKLQELVQKQLRRGVLKSELTLFHHHPTVLNIFLNLEDVMSYSSLGAEEGSARAQYHLGIAYEEGETVNQNFEISAQLYQQASQLGHAEATFNLAVFYDKGTGVQKNVERSAQLYQQAAQLGHLSSIYNLAVAYNEGEGVPQSFEQAVQLYQQASQLGHAAATYNLAVAYSRGDGVTQNVETATQFYHQAAQLGHAIAQYTFGFALVECQGLEQDIPQAVFWFRKAAEQGETNAQKALSILYTHGVGVEKNAEKAKYWLDQSKKYKPIDNNYNQSLLD